MHNLDQLRIKIFADCADQATLSDLVRRPYIQGLTTNPTLMRQAGVVDYETFARDVLHTISDRPVSFEVFADEFDEMEQQAEQIAAWGPNVFVKIPITNTRGESAVRLINRLTQRGVKVNVTAILSLDQVRDVSDALRQGAPALVSVFAGRIADTGRDPLPLMAAAIEFLRPHAGVELIWASPRELLNIFQADAIGCHIITVTAEILNKLVIVGKDLKEYSLETVRMFYRDAQKAGYSLSPATTEARLVACASNH